MRRISPVEVMAFRFTLAIALTSLERNSRINQWIYQVNNQKRYGCHQDNHERSSLDDREILVQDSVIDDRPHALIGESIFHKNLATDQRTEGDGESRDLRQNGVAHHVAIKDIK